jgi:hypothetical protein
MLPLKRSVTFLGLALLLGGCGSKEEQEARFQYKMGERAEVGPLIYTVAETSWKTQLGDLLKMRVPENRFLLIRLSITNSGGKELTLPTFTLETDRGASYPESPNGEGVDQWLGLLRKISPAETLQGQVLFDAPLGSYKLRVTDGGEIGQEKVAHIEIPLRLDSDMPIAPMPQSR